MIYLASPYTHEDPKVREIRYNIVSRKTAELACAGLHVFSPIVNSHPLAEKYDLPKNFDFWEDFDKEMILLAEFVLVLKIDGWEDSEGITSELAFCKEQGVPVFFTED